MANQLAAPPPRRQWRALALHPTGLGREVRGSIPRSQTRAWMIAGPCVPIPLGVAADLASAVRLAMSDVLDENLASTVRLAAMSDVLDENLASAVQSAVTSKVLGENLVSAV